MRMKTLVQHGFSWVIPAHCLICLTPVRLGTGTCADCHGFMHQPTNSCRVCAVQLAPAPVSASVCGRCHRHPPHFDAVNFAFRYRQPLIKRLHEIKFGGKFEYLESAGQSLARASEQVMPRPDLIVPLPLHPQRLRKRSFDQAVEIARVVSRRLAIPLARDGLRRIRETRPQTTLRPAEREKNTRAAFHCPRPLDANRIALIDDVLTTGATCNAAALSLKRAGVAKVSVWVLARA